MVVYRYAATTGQMESKFGGYTTFDVLFNSLLHFSAALVELPFTEKAKQN